MQVLLLGGTGAMGVHLANQLNERGIDVFITSRRNLTSQYGITYLQGNAKDLIFLKSTLSLRAWDAIVDFMIYTTAEFRDRVELLLSSTRQYIFLSSSRVYANTDQPITEQSPRLLDTTEDLEYLSNDEYALCKARSENLLFNSQRRNWTIVRPYITYSEIRLQLGTMEKETWLYRALKGRKIIFAKEFMNKWTTLTYGNDVASALGTLIGRENSFGRIYHITQPHPQRWSEVLNIYLNTIEAYTNKRPSVYFVDLESFISIQSNTYQIIYDRMFNRSFNNRNISEFISVEDFTTPEVGLKVCLEHFLKDPQFLEINWIHEANMDRLSKEHTPLTEIEDFKKKICYLCYRYAPLRWRDKLWSIITQMNKIIKF